MTATTPEDGGIRAMGPREVIATALARVDGLTPSQHEPEEFLPGMAWPALRQVTRDGVFCAPLVKGYDVFVILDPGHKTAASQEAEALIEPVVSALEDIGEWTQPAEVVQLAVPNGQALPALRVRITPYHQDVTEIQE